MDSNRISEIIVKAYGKKYNLKPKLQTRHVGVRDVLDRFYLMLTQQANVRAKLLWASTAAVFFLAAVYYFNNLTTAEHTMLKAASQCEVLMQRRNDITVNLSLAVKGYSQYERQVLEEIVKLRKLFSQDEIKSGKLDEVLAARKAPAAPEPAGPAASANPAARAADIPASLTGLLAIAEQYPDLKLSGNFQNLMNALIEVEKDLAGQRLMFNEAALAYSDCVYRFPSNAFATLFGFKPPVYFKATQEAQSLKPINY
ncbi:MAG: LemA family protein [Desulfovibrionaceae bacterium]|nr:LemA family protein [Desulfovibrionaceae bacterium]